MKLSPRALAHMGGMAAFGGWASIEWGLKDLRTGVAIACYAAFAIFDRWKTEKDVRGVNVKAVTGDAEQQHQIDGIRLELAELRGFVKAKLGGAP